MPSVSMKSIQDTFTIDESSFETYLKYEKYEDGFFWMGDRAFFMVEIIGGIGYYSAPEELLNYYVKLKVLFRSLPEDSDAYIQSFFMPYRDVLFEPPAAKTSIPAIRGFYDDVVKQIKDGPKKGYLDSKSLLRDMRNFLIITFPIRQKTLTARLEDKLDQRSMRFGSSYLETFQIWKKAFLTTLESLSVRFTELRADDFLYVMFTLLNQDFDPIKTKYIPEIPLKRQLLYNIVTTDHHEVAYSSKRWAIGYLENMASVDLGFLMELTTLRRPFFVSTILHRMPRLKFQAIMYGRKKSTFDRSRIADIDQLLLDSQVCDPFGAEVYVGVLVDDFKEVETVRSELANFTSEYGWDFKFETSIAPDMFRASLPGHYNEKATRPLLLLDDYALCFLNFRNFRKQFSTSGVLLVGEDMSPKAVNIFDSHAYGTMISGGSGSGKTMFAQYMIMSYLAQGYKIFVIDPLGNYEALCEAVDGSYYRLGLSEGCRGLDCFPDLSYEELIQNKDLISMTLSFIEKLIGLGSKDMSFSAQARSVLQKALLFMYQSTPKAEITTLREVLEGFRTDPKISGNFAAEFAASLEMFLPNGLYGNLISTEPLEISNHFTVFDIGELRDRSDLCQLAIYGLMTKISALVMQAASSRQKCLLYIDESHYIVADPMSVSFIKNGVRVWRTFGSGLILITQQLTDMLENKDVGDGIFKTLNNFFILYQSAASIDAGQAYLGYNDAEREAMKDLKTIRGKYSFFSYYTRSLNPEGDPAFGRFYLSLPRYMYFLTTSVPDEKANRMIKWKHYMSSGMSKQAALHQAVLDCVAEEAAIGAGTPSAS